MRMFAWLLIVCPLTATLAVGQPTDSAPEIGDPAPAWSDLPGTDDQLHSLSDLADHAVIVVCFTCNTCPYSVDYEDRLIALQSQFVADGDQARLVAINSNTIEADQLAAMKERAHDKGFNFPYLSDATQDVARGFGAIYTPEFFVLNQDRQIVYRGALDDNTDPEKVTHSYVESAVGAVLSGKTPEIQKTGARGCTIRFERQRRQPPR